MTSPYDGLDDSAYWRSGVVDRPPGRLRGLYRPRVAVTSQSAILTAGSCFAQYVHRELKAAGAPVIEMEPPPQDSDAGIAARFFYGVFSARYGNIYNPRQFLQLLREAKGISRPAHPIWTHAGRHIDALRPNVDPGGFDSAEAVRHARAHHLSLVAQALAQVDVVILTLGLHETWEDRASGTVYPVAPHVLAAPPAGADIGFLSLSHDDVVNDLRAVLALLRQDRPQVRMILTVAPGPLIATASGKHVLAASTSGKAILRAAVDTLMRSEDGVDYFPSYEIITNPAARGRFYQPNLRNPTPRGVALVMRHFLSAHGLAGRSADTPTHTPADGPADPPTHTPAHTPSVQGADHAQSRFAMPSEDNELICEELLHDPQLRNGGHA